ncbi:hypothetical protein [Mycobacteroides abscessus]|uniref:hypothetical protein n=1 Tax=Mycobacteroides abscessus TaxID=36809 RepID=UPI0009A5F7F6|nr:hypothetical protein [Mycobacteroides abscessus]QSN49637.1 hypothetical protein I3U33_26540 [Mycobacteroides abscessus subsp. abscessus]
MTQPRRTRSSAAATPEDEAARRKRRQGSENREMSEVVKFRWYAAKKNELSGQAGPRIGDLMREYGDLLIELLPIADQRGVDPVELIRQTASQLLDRDKDLAHTA